MTMTRQDFQLIADVLKTSGEWGAFPTKASQAILSENLANVLQRTNPNFDRARFLKACGVKS